MNHTAKIILAALVTCGTAQAATIVWDPVNSTTTESDVLTNGTLLIASNSGGNTEAVINGVTFAAQPGGPLPNNFDGATFTGDGGDTGSASLNNLLNSHSYLDSATTFDITGLILGQAYAIQIFAVGDTRSCCASRTQIFGGDGSFSGDLLRGDASSVVGFFTADGTTQTIDVAGGSVDPVDPGLSGFQVRVIPEPSSALLLGFAGLALLRRRRSGR